MKTKTERDYHYKGYRIFDAGFLAGADESCWNIVDKDGNCDDAASTLNAAKHLIDCWTKE
jgi:hypothetical protein